MKDKRWLKIVMLLIAGSVLLATPILAYTYRAPLTIIEGNSNDYEMLAVSMTLGSPYLIDNGFMAADALDTTVETYGGTPQPHMVAIDRLLTAHPVLGDSQTNLFFTTGNTPLTSLDIIVGYDGYITTADAIPMELSDNFEIEVEGFVDTTQISNYIVNKDAACYFGVTDTDEISFGIVGPVDYNANAVSTSALKTNANYATCRTSVAADGTGDGLDLGQSVGFNIGRSYILINTAAIPDGVTIAAAELRITSTGDFSNVDFNVVIQNGMPTYPHNPVVVGDFNMAWYAGDGGSLTTAGWVAVGLNVIPLNATGISWINDTGWTKFQLRSSRDIGANQPAGNEYVQINENATVLRVWYATVETTVTGVTSGEYTVKAVADGVDLEVSVEDAGGHIGNSPQDTPLAAATVPDNDNDWEINNLNAIPYMDYYKHTVNGVLITHYEPDTMILGEEYSVGTATFTNADTEVVGAGGATWTDDMVGSLIQSDTDELWHEVATVSDATHLDLTTEYADAGGGGHNYTMKPRLPDLIYESGTADGGTVATLVDAALTQVNDYWNNMVLEIITTTDTFAPQGEKAIITDFVAGADELQFLALTAAVDAGDTYELNNAGGAITWGSNPAGVTVTLDSMVSAGQPGIGATVADPTIDILPAAEASDWYVAPDVGVGGALLTNPIRPFVTIMSDLTTMTERQAWIILGAAFVLLVCVGTARAVRGHLLISGIATGAAIGAMVAMTIFPMWALIFIILCVAAGVLAERSPSI